MDFSGFDLSRASFTGILLDNSDFTDAQIKCVEFRDCGGLIIEQLLATRDFKEGFVEGVEAILLIFPKDRVVNLSRVVFVNCTLGSVSQARIDMIDSVISSCDFRLFNGLTLENIKSTWNYKHNRMEGIKLPPDIQATLDAEKAER